MAPTVNGSLGPMELHKVESRPRVSVHKVDDAYDAARLAIARAVASALTRTGTPLKRLGDKSLVSRWTRGEANPNLAKLWVCPKLRREFVVALAVEAGMSIEVVIRTEAQ